jgi:hypothetical protein
MLNLKNTFVRDIKSTYTVADRNFSTSHDLALFILECEDSMQEITKQSGAYDEQLHNARLQSSRMKVLETPRHMCQCAHHYVCLSLSRALSRLSLSLLHFQRMHTHILAKNSNGWYFEQAEQK